MSLPRLLLITDAAQARRPLTGVLDAAIEAGARGVVLRDRDMPDGERAGLARHLAERLSMVDGLLLLSVDGEAPTPHLWRHGLHLTSTAPAPPKVPGRIVGRSCHDVGEVAAATARGLDYVTVSPVFATASKPGHGPALGPEGLAGLCGRTHLPVFALGGVETGHQALACRRAGAHGIAVMGAVMRAEDPGALVAELLEGSA